MAVEPEDNERDAALRELGRRLRERRKQLRLPAKEVAAAAGITPTYLWMLEAGVNPKTKRPSRPSMSVLAKLVGILQLSPDEPLALAGYPSLRHREPAHADGAPAPAAPGAGNVRADQAARVAQRERPPVHAAPEASSPPARPPLDDAMLPWPEQLVGRDTDLAWLLGRLRAGGTVSVTALGGMGGIGKTALAAVAVRQLRAEGRFPDGIAVVYCQGLTDAGHILQQALARFHPQRRQPGTGDLAELAEIARSLIEGKEALIVLDNVDPALTIEQVVGPLRAAGATLLITARQALPHSVVPVDATHVLDLLHADAALDLFARSLGRGGADDLTDVERAAAERIVAALGRHTLAVKLSAAYAYDAHRDLGALARELEDPARALALPEGEVPEAVRRVFAHSVEELPAAARRLFVALAGFATIEFGRRAALALAAGLDLTAPEASLNLLVLRALLRASTNESMPETGDRERLRLHPLLHAFALAEWVRLPETERHAAQQAIASHYARYINEVEDRAIDPDEENIAGALEWAHEHQANDLVADICTGMRLFWRIRGRTAQSLRYLPWGVAALEAEFGEPAEKDSSAWRKRANNLFWLLLDHGFALQWIGELDEAVRRYEQCLALSRQAEAQSEEGEALARLGQVAQVRGRLDEAEAFYRQSLAIRREVGDLQGEGSVIARLGQVARARGRLDEAEAFYRQSLAIRRQIFDRRGESANLGQLGQTYAARGRLDEAEAFLLQALAIHQEVQDRRGEGIDLGNLGGVAQALGRLDEAEVVLRQSLALRREVDDRRGQAIVLRQLALLAETQGNLSPVETLLRESLAVARKAQDGPRTADSLLELGRFLVEQRNNPGEGCQMAREAIRLYAEMGLAREQEARALAQRLGCLE
jgi:tetratricopeptide (TPR) repeat protein/transcriptional regulator with XRE-family HTH domain